MLNNFSRARLLGWWFGAVALAFVVSAVAGAPITLGAGGLWVVASLVPAAVMLGALLLRRPNGQQSTSRRGDAR